MPIRHATVQDLESLTNIEAASYPEAEAASRESIAARLAVFADHFWILEEHGTVLGFINGIATQSDTLSDEMYHTPTLHNPNGNWLMLFSVVTAPAYRHQGVAQRLLQQVIADTRHRHGIVLTCKPALVGFYAKFGFQDEGVSASQHGETTWHQMRLTF